MPRKAKDKEEIIEEKKVKETATKKTATKKSATKKVTEKKTDDKKAKAKVDTKKAPAKKVVTKTATKKTTASTKKVEPKKAEVKKAAAKKTATKTTTKKAASKTATKKTTASTKKAEPKKTEVKKATARKTATKTTTKKVATKTATKKTTASTKKAEPKKTEVKKATTKKAAAKTTTKKVATKKATTKKTESKKHSIDVVEYYDLPYRYNETVVKVLAQTPEILFVYWDISDADKENYIKQYGDFFFNDTKPVLVIHNNTLKYSYEVDINDFANSWYLHVKDANCDYRIELGRRPINEYAKINDYMSVTSSNEMEAPNDHILFDSLNDNVYFKNVKTDITTAKDITLYFLSKIGKIYNVKDFYRTMYKDENIDFERLNLKNMPSS